MNEQEFKEEDKKSNLLPVNLDGKEEYFDSKLRTIGTMRNWRTVTTLLELIMNRTTGRGQPAGDSGVVLSADTRGSPD